MIVLDASSWVLALVDAGPVGTAAREILSADPDWMAPAHGPIEVLRTIRRYELSELIDRAAADRLATEVVRTEIRLVLPDATLLTYVWQQRHNISPHDAPYLGLAALHGVSLITNDARLARAARALGIAVVIPAR